MASGRRLQLAAVAVFFVAYALLSHYSSSNPRAQDLGAALALAPMLTIGLALIWRWSGKFWAALAAAAALLLLHEFWPLFAQNFSIVALIQQCGFYAIMAFSFGRSLIKDRIPLCTQFADRIHGPLSASELSYTPQCHRCLGHFLLLVCSGDAAAVRVHAIAYLVAVQQFSVGSAHTSHVCGGICRAAPRAAAGAAQRPDRHLARLLRESALNSMGATALLSHTAPTAIVAYRAGVAVTARQFLAAAAHLAESLPDSKHVLNACADRYHFTVGLAACLMSGRVSLLPSTHTPQVIAQLASFAPDAICLTDDRRCYIALPQVCLPELVDNPRHADAAAAEGFRVPEIANHQLAAIVFTSGSTGTPVPYRKTWGLLARCVRDGAPLLGLLDGRGHTLVGTVPGQHMYGFESTVLLALQSGNAFSAERPLYPADVAAAVDLVPRPRVLVTTPIHLRILLASEVQFPPVDVIVSATAPLSSELAREVEEKYRAPLLEIYGSTETGQIAMRRTAQTAAWRLWPGVRLSVSNDEVFAQGGVMSSN